MQNLQIELITRQRTLETDMNINVLNDFMKIIKHSLRNIRSNPTPSSGNTETVQSGMAKKSGQDKQALGVTVLPFNMHLHATVFILEPLTQAKKWSPSIH